MGLGLSVRKSNRTEQEQCCSGLAAVELTGIFTAAQTP